MQIAAEELAPYYQIPDTSSLAKFKFVVSHGYTNFRTRKPIPIDNFSSLFFLTPTQIEALSKPEKQAAMIWSRILPGLYLGQIPIHDEITNHATDIVADVKSRDPELPLGLVVSAVDLFELAGVASIKTVKPSDWHGLNVKHHHIRMSDFLADAPLHEMFLTLLKMRDCIKNGHSVYIHCKAGKGRSALLVLAYLLIFGNGADLGPFCSDDHAFKFLVRMRKQIHMSSDQIKCASEIAKYARNYYLLKNQQPFHATPIEKPLLHDFLGSVAGKEAIRHLSAFKALSIYAVLRLEKDRQPVSTIREAYQTIFMARNGYWLKELLDGTGLLLRLISEGCPLEKTLRENLVTTFKKELNTLLQDQLKYDMTDLELLPNTTPNPK